MQLSKFEQFFANDRIIQTCSPEFRFLSLISSGNVSEACALFPEHRIYGPGEVRVDTPYGEFRGRNEILTMAEDWKNILNASEIIPVPVAQTRAGRRSVTEIALHCFSSDHQETVIPMAAVADLSGKYQMDELRLYWHWKNVPGTPAYRPPAFPERSDHTTRHEMLNGAVRDYMVILHDPDGDIVSKAEDIFAEKLCFGGYSDQEYNYVNRDEFIRPFADLIGHTLSTRVHLALETIIDDGKICCVEWEQIITKTGREQYGRISQAGISFYELNEEGKIWSVRIIDYANDEKYIDWENARLPREKAEALNYLG